MKEAAIAESRRKLEMEARKGNAFATWVVEQLDYIEKFKATNAASSLIGGDVAVVRKGDQIILPPGMPYEEAIEWLHRRMQDEEAVVNILHRIECFPLDGIIAVTRAMEEVYGFSQANGRDFFGRKTPPTQIEIPLHDGKFATAQMGEIHPPKWEEGFIQVHIQGPSVVIQGKVKKKFVEDIHRMFKIAEEKLKVSSIYKGHAMNLDLKFMEADADPFDIHTDAPKFMDTKGANLILNPSTEFDLNTNVFMLIEQTKACLANRMSLKHGSLFRGPFGTGKTLTAKAIAEKAVRNGWTFIYLKDVHHIANALRVAKHYSPCVLFAEDVDLAVKGERSEGMNEILNTLDGVDTKDSAIITILTTNHPENINPAFLRAGRMDSVITFGVPEPKTAERFVKVIGGELLDPALDYEKVGVAMAGLIPAFITEAIQKAKRNAIHRTGSSDLVEKITTEDLVLAAENVRAHQRLVEEPTTITEAERLSEAVATVNEWGSEKVPTAKQTAKAILREVNR